MFRTLSAALVAAAVLAAPAGAAVITYTDSAQWQAATASPVSHAFPGEGAENGIDYPSYAAGGLTFTGNQLYIWNDNSYASGAYLEALGGMNVALDSDLRAVSFNVGTWQDSASIQVTINGIVAATFATSSNPATSFFGVTSDEAITSIGFAATRTGGNGPGGEFPPAFAFDNDEGEPGPELPPVNAPVLFDITSFQTALLAPQDEQPAEVPEPAMLGLFALGALGLAGARRRRA